MLPKPVPIDLRSRVQGLAARALAFIPPGRGREFARSVAYLFTADVIATGLGFVLNVWVVQALGPGNFGQLLLVFSAAQLVVIPLLSGLPTAVTRFLASNGGAGGVVTASLVIFGGLNALVIPALLIFRGAVEAWLGTPPVIFAWAILYGEALALYYITRAMLLGLQRFGEVARLDLAGTAAFAVAAAVVLLGDLTAGFVGILVAHTLRWLVFAAAGAPRVVRLAGRSWKPWVGQLSTYAGLASVSTLAGFFFLGSIDNLMLNHYLGESAVGLYGAYYTVFNLFTTRFMRVFLEALLPAASSHHSQAALFKRVLSMYVRAGWLIIPVGWGLSALLFAVYGSAYPYDWRLGLLMSVSVALYGAIGTLGQLLIAGNMRTMQLGTLGSLVGAAVNVAGNVILIPRLHIAGTMIASIAASIVALSLQVLILKRYGPREGGPSTGTAGAPA